MRLPRPPLIEAHRGDSGNAPENTLAAFGRAVDQGFPWIELDIHATRDGELVVIHDDQVDRTTDGHGAVADLTFAEIRRLDAGSWFLPKAAGVLPSAPAATAAHAPAPHYAGESVPRLTEVIDLVLPTRTRLNIEVKAFPPEAGVPQALTRLLRATGCAAEFVVSSFDLCALLAVRKLAPEIPLALIGNGEDIVPAALTHHLPWIHAHYPTLTHALACQARQAGIKVNIWTLNDPALVPALVQIGVDKICSNYPGLIRQALTPAET